MDRKAYRGLILWQRAMEMVEAVYVATDRLPDDERFGLITQLQRAAVSVPSNIAEGYGRTHRREYLHHLSYARGSLFEVETQLIICVRTKRLSRADAKPAWELAQEVGKLLTTFITTLEVKTSSPRT